MPKFATVVSDRLFALVDAIEKQRKRKQHKQGNNNCILTTITEEESNQHNITTDPTPWSTLDRKTMPTIIEEESNPLTRNNSPIDDDDYPVVSNPPGMFDSDPTIETVLATSATTVHINMAQRLAEGVGKEAKWASERAQREEDRVHRARVHKEERAAERAKRIETRVDRARVRK